MELAGIARRKRVTATGFIERDIGCPPSRDIESVGRRREFGNRGGEP
jgi:hypothetical protein